jgi:methylthioribulose 1-phosphate dehydratase/enolase-phosphatase E1
MSTDISVDEAKDLICQLCRNFYQQGWVSGTGGGISMKAGDKIVMAPSGVQKERMEPDDMFVLDAQGNVLHTPVTRPPPYKPPKLSECAPLFTAVSRLGWWALHAHMQLLSFSLHNKLFQHRGRPYTLR